MYKNPYFEPPIFDNIATSAVLAYMKTKPDVQILSIEDLRKAIPALVDKEDGYVAQCAQDALERAAIELNATPNAPDSVSIRRARSWIDFVA